MQLIQCPSCGGSNEIKNPGITMVPCRYCHSTLYWNEDAIVHAGEKAVIPENDSLLALGATGSVNGHDFEVIGRIRFAYGLGHWDEWFITYDNDFAWLGEADNQFTLRRIIPHPDLVMGRQRPALGASLILCGDDFTIREADRAQCMTIEGELPFNVPPTESMNYFNAASADGLLSALIMYNQQNQLRLTMGLPLKMGDIKITSSISLAAQYDQMEEAEALSCAACGAALPSHIIPGTLTLTCESCGSIHEIAGSSYRLLGKNDNNGQADNFDLEIGDSFSYEGIDYEVCGRMVSNNSDDDEFNTLVLYAEGQPFLFLEEYLGDYRIYHETLEAPNGNPQQWMRLIENDQITVGDEDYTIYTATTLSIKYVDGALPWLATVGQEYSYAIAESGSLWFSLKQTKNKFSFYAGEELDDDEYSEAAGIYDDDDDDDDDDNSYNDGNNEDHDNKTRSPAPATNNGEKKSGKGCGIGCLIFFLIFCVICYFLGDEPADSSTPEPTTTEQKSEGEENLSPEEAADSRELAELVKKNLESHNGYAKAIAMLDSTSDQFDNHIATVTSRFPSETENIQYVAKIYYQTKEEFLTLFKQAKEQNDRNSEHLTRKGAIKASQLFREFDKSWGKMLFARANLSNHLASCYQVSEVILQNYTKYSGNNFSATYKLVDYAVTPNPKFQTFTFTLTGAQARTIGLPIDNYPTAKDVGLTVFHKPLGKMYNKEVEIHTSLDKYDRPNILNLFTASRLAPGSSALNQITGEWQDDTFTFKEKYSGLPTMLWEDCGQPASSLFAKTVSQDELNAAFGINGTWIKSCNFYQNIVQEAKAETNHSVEEASSSSTRESNEVDSNRNSSKNRFRGIKR